MSRATLCLSMIVKDEAHVLAELLESLAPYLDHWVVVDTGSTDGTQELVRAKFQARGVPGELHERPWRDFGYNRSEALLLCDGKADYAWVIDADDRIHGELRLPDLTHDAYDLRYGPDFVYWRRQIFRTGLGWHFRGVLHEYPSSVRATDSGRLDGPYHIESGRSGARNRVPDKYRRDAAVLERAVRDEPGNERYWFYLGQSLFDAGDPRAARSAYARRVELGGWDEETYYALFRIAVCDEALGEPEERVIESFLRAHEARPSRAEPLHALAHACCRRERWELGYLFAEQATAIPFPERDQLFVHADVYLFRALDELAICAFYTGRLDAGHAACQELLKRDLPEADRERILGNLPHFDGPSSRGCTPPPR